MSTESDLAASIAALVVPSMVVGTNVFTGPVRKAAETANAATGGKVPHRAVFCLGTGGIDDIPYVDGGLKQALRQPTVQVWIRSDPENYDDGKALADAVFDAIDKNPPTGYAECRALGSRPAYVVKDEKGHHLWTVNVLLRQPI